MTGRRRFQETLVRLAFQIAWTAGPDPYPDAPVSARSLCEVAAGPGKAADHLDAAAKGTDAIDRNARSDAQFRIDRANGESMASITSRNLEGVKGGVRVRAAGNGRLMEEGY